MPNSERLRLICRLYCIQAKVTCVKENVCVIRVEMMLLNNPMHSFQSTNLRKKNTKNILNDWMNSN